MRHPQPPWRSTSSSVPTMGTLFASMNARLPSSDATATVDIQLLRRVASWIRDDLDPLIAREGPDMMRPDDVLALHELLQSLQTREIRRTDIALSRIHLAIREIAGKSSRWPRRLIDECDKVIEQWETAYGLLSEIHGILYEPGGRLHGISLPTDLTRESLLERWRKEDPSLLDNGRACARGDGNFKPGQWWLNATFAYRDGIIDSKTTNGGITHNADGAFAILLKDDDELEGATQDRFTYRSSHNDVGRYKLTAANHKARQPVRVLRSHTLTSFWAPRAGVRYDGLYSITGWKISTMNDGKLPNVVQYHVHFKRDPEQRPMSEILSSPNAEDIDDYVEFKRIRRLQRDFFQQEAAAKLSGSTMPQIGVLEKQIIEKPPSRAATFFKYCDGQIVFPQTATAEETWHQDSQLKKARTLSSAQSPWNSPTAPDTLASAHRTSTQFNPESENKAPLMDIQTALAGMDTDTDSEAEVELSAVEDYRKPSFFDLALKLPAREQTTTAIFEDEVTSEESGSSSSARLSTPTRWLLGRVDSSSAGGQAGDYFEANHDDDYSSPPSGIEAALPDTSERHDARCESGIVFWQRLANKARNIAAAQHALSLQGAVSHALKQDDMNDADPLQARRKFKALHEEKALSPALGSAGNYESIRDLPIPGAYVFDSESSTQSDAPSCEGQNWRRLKVSMAIDATDNTKLGLLEFLADGSADRRDSRSTSSSTRRTRWAGKHYFYRALSLPRNKEMRTTDSATSAEILEVRPVFREVEWKPDPKHHSGNVDSQFDPKTPWPGFTEPKAKVRYPRMVKADRAAVARGLLEMVLRQCRTSQAYLTARQPATDHGDGNDATIVRRLAVQCITCLKLVWHQIVEADYVDLPCTNIFAGIQNGHVHREPELSQLDGQSAGYDMPASSIMDRDRTYIEEMLAFLLASEELNG